MQAGFALVRHAAGAQAEGPAGAAERPEARLRRLQRRHPGGAQGHRARARSTPPSPSPPTSTPSTRCTTSRRRSTGKTFKPGPTDHDSTIIQVRDGLLEDQLSAPLVTADGGTYGGEPSVKCDDTSLWGNHLMSVDRATHGSRWASRRPTGPSSRRRASPSVRLDRRARRRRHHRRPRARRTRSSAATAPASRRWSSILTGLQAPDAGDGRLRRRARAAARDRDAWRRRVACVYQKSTIIPDADRRGEPLPQPADRGRGGLISWRALRRQARGPAGDLVGATSTSRPPAGDLTVEQRQFVEIARALSFGARFIILDEPTAQLDGAGIDRLFDRIRDLQRAGRDLPVHQPPPAGGLRDLRHGHGLPRRPAHPHRAGRRAAAAPTWSPR